jgi:hypothetical protein
MNGKPFKLILIARPIDFLRAAKDAKHVTRRRDDKINARPDHCDFEPYFHANHVN